MAYRTPGVYIKEESSFPTTAVAVPTAVPAFIGYTQKAKTGTSKLHMMPWKISSLADYHEAFGFGPDTKFEIVEEDGVELAKPTANLFYLYDSMKLFFANGGSDCYIVSIGQYADDELKPVAVEPKKDDFIEGIFQLERKREPTMLVAPDAMLLEDPKDVQVAMLNHCADLEMQNRVAILDVKGADKHLGWNENAAEVTKFREGVGENNLMWGTAYYPWVNSSVNDLPDLDANVFSDIAKVKDAVAKESGELEEEQTALLDKLAAIKGEDPFNDFLIHQNCRELFPSYKRMLRLVAEAKNLLPPSGAAAGVISMVDNTRGVWQSPANVSLAMVNDLTIELDNKEQRDLNAPTDGKSINAIRSFPGRGVLVWGARTLDGNSLDWRYLSVRRTVIMLEQSLKIACEGYVFEPNNANTWVNVKGMMYNFLKDQWQQGALAGTTPDDAFSVDIGLGVTMTSIDVLEGLMKVTVKVAVTRPAEFIEITIQQQMQKS